MRQRIHSEDSPDAGWYLSLMSPSSTVVATFIHDLKCGHAFRHGPNFLYDVRIRRLPASTYIRPQRVTANLRPVLITSTSQIGALPGLLGAEHSGRCGDVVGLNASRGKKNSSRGGTDVHCSMDFESDLSCDETVDTLYQMSQTFIERKLYSYVLDGLLLHVPKE